MREERDKEEKMTNIIIKGLKDFGKKDKTDILARNFLKDELHWTGGIQQANMIGKIMELGRDRHVRVTLRSMEEKARILKNRGLRKGTRIYLDEDLTLAQQEGRKEWEKVKSS